MDARKKKAEKRLQVRTPGRKVANCGGDRAGKVNDKRPQPRGKRHALNVSKKIGWPKSWYVEMEPRRRKGKKISVTTGTDGQSALLRPAEKNQTKKKKRGQVACLRRGANARGQKRIEHILKKKS